MVWPDLGLNPGLLDHWRSKAFYYYYLLRVFHTNACRYFFTGFLVTASHLRSPGLFSVFRTNDLNSAVVWMVSTRSLIPKSLVPSPCTNPLVTVPTAPITIGISFTLMLHNFLNFLARCMYLSFFHFVSILLCVYTG